MAKSGTCLCRPCAHTSELRQRNPATTLADIYQERRRTAILAAASQLYDFVRGVSLQRLSETVTSPLG